MTTSNKSQRMIFGFRRNGNRNGQRLIEITAAPLEQHEVAPGVDKQSWFGPEDSVTSALKALHFSSIDVEGIMGALHTNRDATREVDVLPSDLVECGFSPSV